MMLYSQIVLIILTHLLTFSDATTKIIHRPNSSSEFSGISSQGSNGGSHSIGKRPMIDLNRDPPREAQSYVSTAHSMQKKQKQDSLKDTASSPNLPPITPPKSIQQSNRKKRVPNPFPIGSLERKAETHRRQVAGAYRMHQRRKQAKQN